MFKSWWTFLFFSTFSVRPSFSLLSHWYYVEVFWRMAASTSSIKADLNCSSIRHNLNSCISCCRFHKHKMQSTPCHQDHVFMVNAPTNIMRHFRRKKNFLRSQFCKFTFPKVTSWFSSTSKLYASPIAIFNILFCSLCLSPFSVHMVTTSCFPGIIKQYLPDERMLVWYQCDTVLTCGMSFFFCCIRSKDAAKALTTTFFLRGLCGSAFLTFFMAFPRYCLDMSETFTIIGLCAKEWFFSFFFSLLLSRQRAVASLSFALNVVWLCLLSEAFTLWSSFFRYSSKFRFFCLSLHSLCHWAFDFPRIWIESKFYQCLIFGS